MALDLTDLREALAATIKASIDRDVNVYGGYIPANPTAPCVVIKPAGTDYIDYGLTFCERPECTIRFEVWLLTNPALGTDGQQALDQMLSVGAGQNNSIYDALMADSTLGGVVPDGSLMVRTADYRERMLWGSPDSQTVFDWAVLNITVRQRG